ncbi:hypothetical protein M4I21_02315 [Cellulophaga sp. 20_2_10]|uniref:hypothetical protein n=1 Tax=Cellulophaga sp. 20_2_10 TaxID=2942476 RepID=UPI00201A9BE4|nr:hypothetical protein [Cellulophaga sp. 20_2_10]MCL5244625.1 hypothetical protein [Cellulophaga sp. 20_2_10]
MKNIDKITPFTVSASESSYGVLTTLTVKNEVSVKKSISCKEQTLVASYIYNEDDGYNLVYTVIDDTGKAESFIEDDGILPTLFINPDLENYVSLIPYHPDKELEISIPLFNRGNTDLPKGNRPFTGGFIGVSKQFSIFYDVDIWDDKKPDKLLAMEFKNGVLKKKYNKKVPLPRDNNIYINANEIHLLSSSGNTWLHRQIDEKGTEVKSRALKATTNYFWQIISLSFESNSYVLYEKKGEISIETITADNVCSSKAIIAIKDEFFNTWQPVQIKDDTFIVQFNTEFGNGWLTIKNDEVLELFYSKDTKGYKNLISGDVLELEEPNLIIASINKTKENGYAVVFYPSVERKEKNKKILVFQKRIH